MSELKREELLDSLDTMLIRTIADISEEWQGNIIGKEMRRKIRQAYKQIVVLIKKPQITEEQIEEKATELYNYLYYETFSLDQVEDFVRSLFKDT